MSTKRRVAGTALVLFLLATSLLAQSTPDAIKARLKDRPLYIRGFWSDDTLHFDGNGNLAALTKRSTFTLAGFTFSSLMLADGVLRIYGKPVGVKFENNLPKRVDLPFRKRTIEITAPANGDFGHALDAIFADGIEALAPTLPDYWQPWARKAYPKAYSASDAVLSPEAPASSTKMNRSISPARLLHSTVATSSDAAKELRYDNPPLISLFVEADGKLTNISIVRPSGLGLDEAAIFCVQDWHFAPAQQHGQPIRSEIAIESNFFSFPR